MNYEDFINDPRFRLFFAGVCIAYGIPLVEVEDVGGNSRALIFESTGQEEKLNKIFSDIENIDRKKVLAGMQLAIKLIYTT